MKTLGWPGASPTGRRTPGTARLLHCADGDEQLASWQFKAVSTTSTSTPFGQDHAPKMPARLGDYGFLRFPPAEMSDDACACVDWRGTSRCIPPSV